MNLHSSDDSERMIVPGMNSRLLPLLNVNCLPLHVSVVNLLQWNASRARYRGANTDLMTCIILAQPIGGGGEVLLTLIGALCSAFFQDYYINWSDLITLGMQEKRMEYVIFLQIHTS